MTEPRFRWEANTVIAALESNDVGRITVPHISFQFPTGVCVPLAGIGGVSVDESVRRRGIAAGMMQRAHQFALDHGYTCSAVSAGNHPRRLYARAGHVYLFNQRNYSGPLATEQAGQVAVRPYCDDDEAAVLSFVKQVQRPYFGVCEKNLVWWRKSHSWYTSEEGCRKGGQEPVGVIAEKHGEIIGFCERFLYWPGLVAGLFVPPDIEDRLVVADALLYALSAAVRELGETELTFSISEGDQPLVHLLWARGYRPAPACVFQFKILDLPGLLNLLRPMFEERATALDKSVLAEAITLTWGEQSGTLGLGGSGAALDLVGSRELLTQIVCGMISAWEGYLRGGLTLRPKLGPEVAQALQALLPEVPYHHPASDRW